MKTVAFSFLVLLLMTPKVFAQFGYQRGSLDSSGNCNGFGLCHFVSGLSPDVSVRPFFSHGTFGIQVSSSIVAQNRADFEDNFFYVNAPQMIPTDIKRYIGMDDRSQYAVDAGYYPITWDGMGNATVLFPNHCSCHNTNLEHYRNNYTNNPDGSQTITYSEPDDITVDSILADSLGYSQLILRKGIRTIQVSADSGISTVYYPTAISVVNPGGVVVVVTKVFTIAKYHSNRCPGTCECGIGFACPLRHETIPTSTAPTEEVHISTQFDASGNVIGLKMVFTQSHIDWHIFGD